MKVIRRGLAVLLVCLLVLPRTDVQTLAEELFPQSETENGNENGTGVGAEGSEVKIASEATVSSGDGRDVSSGDGMEPGDAEDIPSGDLLEPGGGEVGGSIGEDSLPGEDEDASDAGSGLENEGESGEKAEVLEELGGEGDLLEKESQLSEGQIPAAQAGDIASGADGDITWVIDADGKLTISGTGDFSLRPDNNNYLWNNYLLQITSAEVNLTGMTDASRMFSGCQNLESVDMSNFDTSNVTDMSDMFCVGEKGGGISRLRSLDISSFDTGKVTDMSSMFSGCGSLLDLEVSNF